MANYFVMVGRGDVPIFELELTGTGKVAVNAGGSEKRDEHRHLNQFIMHASLDVVEDVMWNTQNMYLKIVDKFNEFFISAFVSAGCVKMLLLHETRYDDSIKSFFSEVHELYLKVLMNPFYERDTPITSSTFLNKVKISSKRHL